MGSVNNNFLPASTGLALGNANQRWTGYLQSINFVTLTSSSPNPALSEEIQLANSDAIAWRNNGNSGDIVLETSGAANGTTPVDCLKWGGSGFLGSLISGSANPGSGGAIRLAASDLVVYRNNGNSADVNALQLGGGDGVIVGDSSGVTMSKLGVSGDTTVTGNFFGTGIFASSAVVTPICNAPAGSNLLVEGGNAINSSSNGNNLYLYGGSATFNGNGGAVVISPGQGATAGVLTSPLTTSPGTAIPGLLYIQTTVSLYNGIQTFGNGMTATYAQDDQTGLSATRGPITLATLPSSATSGGHYRLNYVLEVTTLDASGNHLNFSTNFTSGGIVRGYTGASVAMSSTANADRGCIAINLDNNVGINYTVTASAAITGQYAVHVWVCKE
jgi:hypothetical protein